MSFFVQKGRRNQAFTEPFWQEWIGALESVTGRAVNWKTALQVATVFACCRVIGNGMAQVPFKLMQKSGRVRSAATKHPLFRLLSLKPNDWQTSFEFRQMLAWHIELCGNAYVFINRNSAGKILELIPLPPGQVTPNRDENLRITYDVTGLDGTFRTLN
jgi:HK97 family phage portal protein